ncbi:adenylate kinase 7 isoform X1 [Ornithorhynchus anatinus]|uniref:Adenylate kinase 7 n=1 Tax=Ornithorhynchus anatinus TaxID=9258 RepID=A0A6I8PDN5_ORNAN|nr:adenylate kinase 7 isoform X1 [Ornithorhynchus anatinus]
MSEDEEGPAAAPAEKAVRSQRLFVNRLDSYGGRNIAEHLSKCVVGASLEEVEEEEEEDDENKSISAENIIGKAKEGTFQIVGTLSTAESEIPNFALETYFNLSRESLQTHLLECDVIIYNINENAEQIEESVWAVSALHSMMDHFVNRKTFILLSTVMTWARTKPFDPDDPEIPFTEEDYRRRKAHPNFIDHLNAEKTVIKLGKTNKQKFSTYVVAAGLTYGAEGGILHSYFKNAWLGEIPALPIFGEGTNIIPTIHILDLAGVLQNIADHRPRTHYLIAVDDSLHTLGEIVKCISKNAGSGKVQKFPKENAFLSKDLTQASLDHLLVNLRMEAVFLKENFNIRWVAQAGLVESIGKIFKEYKKKRGLLPIKICIVGPPAVGKSTIAEALCQHYKLHHIQIKDVISEAIAKLELTVAPRPEVEQDEQEEAEEEEEDNIEDAQELLDGVKENMEQNAGRLDDNFLIRFMKEKLKSMPCQNQGYVLDGFPKTYDQAKDLFNNEEEEEEEEIRSHLPPFDKLIMPDYVIALDASDEFLKERVMNLPESIVAGTHYSQDRFLRTLNLFRDINTEDETVLNYFDELEIHPQHIDVGKFEDLQNRYVIKQLIKDIGEPRNYGLTDEEKAELQRKAAEARLAKEAAAEAERERKEALEKAEKIARWEEWNKQLEEVKREEQELLEAQSIPLRNYLMKNVMPTLLQGLNECCKVRPDDPVDFLDSAIHLQPELDFCF